MMRATAFLAFVCLLLVWGCTEGDKKPEQGKETAATPAKTAPEEKEQAPAGQAKEEVVQTPTEKAEATGETQESEEGEEMTQESKEVEVGVMETDFGKIVIEFYPDLAPKTVARIKELINKEHYDGLIFHRIVPGFCIQGGDPTGTGSGGTGVKIPGEFTKTPYVDGSVGMARTQDPDSNDCQFFITLGRTANLDNQYTLFGKVIEGLDVVHKIEKVETMNSRPANDVHIKSFKLEMRKLDK
jgi:peptidylprolyl isomerase